MKAKLLPLYFKSGRDEGFGAQLKTTKNLLADEADVLEPVALGSALPDADAVVLPQVLGDAYSQVDDIRKIDVPILAITSEFGTMSMWDWEIASFLKEEGKELILPYNLDQSKKLCKSLAVKRQMKDTKFLVFQDNPGEGFQAEIFKRFFWWEDMCMQLIKDKFGVTIVKKSFKEFGARAKEVPDAQARKLWKIWGLKAKGVSERALISALKIYLAVKKDIDSDKSIRGVGINCLNESHFSDTTPCLAWNMLFDELQVVWGCEADTMSLLTNYLAHHCLGAPIMMTNIYPFLMGMAALKHEHIEAFPETDDPDNCILLAHCGYFGIVPNSQATQWVLKPKVLAIVDDNATAIDARLPVGPATMIKLGPTLGKLMVVDCDLESYVQYPEESDCRNGAVIRVSDGHELMSRVYSHHQCLLSGRWKRDLEIVAKVFDLQIEQL